MAYRTTAKMAERKDARRRNLLETALKLFGERGYHATTVPMIVVEAQSSIGSFYLYFRNKEDIFAATLRLLGERLEVVVAEAKASVTDPVRQIREAVRRLFLFLAEHPADARILIVESSGLSPELERVRRNILSARAEAARETLAAHPECFPVEIAEVAARCLVGAAMEGLCSWLELSEDVRLPAEKVADSVAAFAVAGVTGGSAQRTALQ